jgi:predicted TIM-barrel fold metal-dependent hydrolase
LHRVHLTLVVALFSGLFNAAAQTPLTSPLNSPSLPTESSEKLDGREGRELALREFRPRSSLRVQETLLQQAKFPVVDVHTHPLIRQHHNEQALDDFVSLMDRNNIAVCVSMDGKLGDTLRDHLRMLHRKHSDRFVVFAHLDFMGDGQPESPATWACNRPGWAERSAEELRAAHAQGVAGLKVFKQLGLQYRDSSGKLIPVDAPFLDPIWKVCGELGMPVLIHTADPPAFFAPQGPENERWEEISRHPDWHFFGQDFPSYSELMEARNRLLARHPQTNFIAAHMASSSEDLQQLSDWLEKYPNLYLDPASRISELGRQPYTSRDFIIRYADRILFGTDGPWPEQRVRLYWRFFETRDEYFPYSEKPFPPQGFWQIYGISLPDNVLEKIYHANAARIIPGVAERLEKFSRN